MRLQHRIVRAAEDQRVEIERQVSANLRNGSARPLAFDRPGFDERDERRVERQWRFVRVRQDALVAVEDWVSRSRRHWSGALDRLEALAAAQTPDRRKS